MYEDEIFIKRRKYFLLFFSLSLLIFNSYMLLYHLLGNKNIIYDSIFIFVGLILLVIYLL